MKTFIIEVKGIVQGVGFRPFVYQIAHKLSLKGEVCNTALGVKITLQATALEPFLEAMQKNLPPLASINAITYEECFIDKTFTDFSIRQSQASTHKSSAIPADIAICSACKEELFTQKDRRFHYFFNNCTNCGPRYSLIKTIPYDRKQTSMKDFTMCSACQSEYENPLDRRYHAQPISCDACGPSLMFLDTKQKLLATNYAAIQVCAQALEEGAILAIKGMGGFHLVCDATSDSAVHLLRERKRRAKKPLAVMFKDEEALKKVCMPTMQELALLRSKQAPIVLTDFKTESLSEYIAPNMGRVGAFLAYTPFYALLLEEFQKPIVATSANRSGEPVITKVEDIYEKLLEVVDGVLDYDRDIINACDDSVMSVSGQQNIFLRQARGFTPKSFFLEKASTKKILAVGAYLKNAIALCIDEQVFLSPYIANLDSVASMEYFKRTIETFSKMYDFRPELIVCDKHPEYASSRWAKEQGVEVLEVYHHHAHILSVMLEQKLEEKVLGIAFDGVGLGENNALWGGEFLVCEKEQFYRVASFEPLALIGADKAAKEPRRVALALALKVLREEEVFETSLVHAFTTKELKLLLQAFQKGLNTPLTSSVGRLFDGVASLLGVLHQLSFEGESGLLLENLYDASITEHFYFEFKDGLISYNSMIKELLYTNDVKKAVSMFFNTLVEVIVTVSKAHKLPVVFSGGVFQNRVLVGLLQERLKQEQVRYYFPQNISANDACIALGQIQYALLKQQ